MAPTQAGAAESEFDAPFVFTADGRKSLYFTFDQLQSRMCSERPTQLDVDYTRTMMGFLLFERHPAHIAMIGLGGGSLLKFCYRHLPGTQLTAIEINPHVIALRREFEVPDDAARISIVCADGADFVRALPSDDAKRYDVLLVDGYDSQGQPASLCSQRFYDDCYRALAPEGILVVNLHHDLPEHPLYTERIRRAFDGHVLEVASQEKSNSILFARKGRRMSVDELRQSDPLEHLDQEVRAQLRREFARIGWEMRQAAE